MKPTWCVATINQASGEVCDLEHVDGVDEATELAAQMEDDTRRVGRHDRHFVCRVLPYARTNAEAMELAEAVVPQRSKR